MRMQNNYELKKDFVLILALCRLALLFRLYHRWRLYCIRERIASKWDNRDGVRPKLQPWGLKIFGDRASRTAKEGFLQPKLQNLLKSHIGKVNSFKGNCSPSQHVSLSEIAVL